MNKLEARYAGELGAMLSRMEIEWFAFEAVKLRLADKTFYTPDFFVMNKAGELECHEVKGFWEDDARVKIKCAAEKFPFKFVAKSYSAKSGWKEEEI